ncbi:MAG: GxxExxY protein [Phycisphaeraceae bacterium]
MEDQELTRQIIGCAYAVYNELGSGFLESVYQRSLLIELQKLGLSAQVESPVKVYYDEQIVGEFRADLIVRGRVIVELKAIEALTKAHEVQVVNYLRATSIEIGLLLNFGQTEVQVRRLTKTPPQQRSENRSR